MNLTTTAKFDKVKHPAESILYGIDFGPLLLPGETLIGTPTIANALTTVPPLTIAPAIVNTATFVNDDGVTVPIGEGVQARISAGLAPNDYVLTVTCGTSQTNVRTVVCNLQVRDA